MSTPDGASPSVFVSYSHQDKNWLERLQIHLTPLVRSGAIDLWDDTRIGPGAAWQTEIERALAAAQVAVLLISADFLASAFIQDQELPTLLEAAQSRGTRIIPLILGYCLFSTSPLGRFKAANDPSNPLEKLTKADCDEVLSNLARAILAGVSDRAAIAACVGPAITSQRIPYPTEPHVTASYPATSVSRLTSQPHDVSASRFTGKHANPAAFTAEFSAGVVHTRIGPLDSTTIDHSVPSAQDPKAPGFQHSLTPPTRGPHTASTRESNIVIYLAREDNDLIVFYNVRSVLPRRIDFEQVTTPLVAWGDCGEMLFHALFDNEQGLRQLLAQGSVVCEKPIWELPIRLRLQTEDDTIAALPWHCLCYGKHRLAQETWTMDVVLGPPRVPEAERRAIIDTALIVVDGSAEFRRAAFPYLMEVKEELRALTTTPATEVRLAQDAVALRRELGGATLPREHADPPELIYVLSEVPATYRPDLQGTTQNPSPRLLDLLVAHLRTLPDNAPQPICWLDLVISGDFKRVVVHSLAELRRYCAHLLVQLVDDPIRCQGRTTDWLRELVERGGTLSRLHGRSGDAATFLWTAADTLYFRSARQTDAHVIYRIRRLLIQVLLGRDEEKAILRDRIRGAKEGDIIGFVVCGDSQACVHSFAEQLRTHVHRNRDLRLKLGWVAHTMQTDDDAADLRATLYSHLGVGRRVSVQEALERIAQDLPGRDEITAIAIPWLLEPGPEFSPADLKRWLHLWLHVNLDLLRESIPQGWRLVLGGCVQWPNDWVTQQAEIARTIQQDANEILANGEWPLDFWGVRIPGPLGLLDLRQLRRFFADPDLREDLACPVGRERAVAEHILTETQGRFDDTVHSIYRNYKDSYAAIKAAWVTR